MVMYACNPSYLEGLGRRSSLPNKHGETLFESIKIKYIEKNSLALTRYW